MKKKNIWFLTLFSLVLVLSVYYITMPDDLLLNTSYTEPTANISEMDETSSMVAMRVSKEEKTLDELEELNNILTDVSKSSDEKSMAYEKMKNINKIKSEELTLEEKIKNTYSLKSVIDIQGNNINVLVKSNNKDINLANNIMRLIQDGYDKKMYISVKFE